MSYASEEIESILRRPGAAELYKKTRTEAWVAPFFACRSRTLQRLGATLLLDELLCRLDPGRAAAVAEAIASEERGAARRDKRQGWRVESMRKAAGLEFFCDRLGHLVCTPYSKKNLYRMTDILGISRNYMHTRARYQHVDIPKRRFDEVAARCTVVRPREILAICKGEPIT